MNEERNRHLAQSVHQRLLNRARASNRPFNELLQYFAMERFLYRLSCSRFRDRFVLKGALMLVVWDVAVTRPTLDIDLLGKVGNDPDEISSVIREICDAEVDPDGLEFDPQTVTAELIAEEAEYHGVRVRFRGRLGNARIQMQTDIGFGDAVFPSPEANLYPVLLDHPQPELQTYSRESSIAEKFHTMVRRGLLNSRLRDYFDVWTLSRHFDFEGQALATAIRETFHRRGQSVPTEPVGLTPDFARDRSRVTQWRGFLRKGRLEGAPSELMQVVDEVRQFLGPLAEALGRGAKFRSQWRAPGPWS